MTTVLILDHPALDGQGPLPHPYRDSTGETWLYNNVADDRVDAEIARLRAMVENMTLQEQIPNQRIVVFQPKDGGPTLDDVLLQAKRTTPISPLLRSAIVIRIAGIAR